jgi:hypothetical protein
MNEDLLLIGIPEGIKASDLDILFEVAATLRPVEVADRLLAWDMDRLFDAILRYADGEAAFKDYRLFDWIMVRVRARRMGCGLVM